ncbi:MAG: cyanophycinase [Candidatus Saccharicenans sp.]
MKSFQKLIFAVKVLLLTVFLLFSACKKSSPTGPTPPEDAGYAYYFVGNQDNAKTAVTSGYVLMGGGADVDDAFRWMVRKARGGDFVVLRSSGTGAYNSYIYNLGEVDSVETLVVYSIKGASDQFVVDKVKNAEAIFIAGGDQSDYLRFWKGTQLQAAINYAISRGAVVGGTSAGLSVLGQFIYAAYRGTVYSPEALADPYHYSITLDKDFLNLPLLQRTITDSHFVTRNRMGRLLVFLARIIKDGWASEAKGIGVDEATALLVEADGTASLVGAGAAYFLLANHMPEMCFPSTPLTFTIIPVYKMRAGDSFNFLSWQGSGGQSYYISVVSGILSSSISTIY